MNKAKIAKIMTALCAVTLSATLLGGCMQQQTSPEQQAQAENREYMSQVNQTMEDLQTRLSSFTDAVSRKDVVTMRTQADNAFKALDSLSSQDAPEALKDVKEKYVSGCDSLKSALNDYITLYTEIESATDEKPFDWTTYDQRLSDIKTAYDKGISELKSADETVANLQK